jgi:sulfite exporter TauE/SafE
MTALEIGAAFGLGFVGSVHCAQMCGPLVLAYTVPMGGQRIAAQAMSHAAYNGGRLATYAILGAAAGAAGGAVDVVGRVAGIAHAAAIAGGVALVLFGLAQAGLWPARAAAVRVTRPGLGARLSSLSARWLQAPGASRKLVLGLVLGLLPCGLLYAALLQAMTTGSWADGALSMAAFGAGTAPALLGIGFASGPIGRLFAGRGLRVAAVAVTLVGVLLIWRGVMVPTPAAGAGHACH